MHSVPVFWKHMMPFLRDRYSWFVLGWYVVLIFWALALAFSPAQYQLANRLYSSGYALFYVLGAIIAVRQTQKGSIAGPFKKSFAYMAVALGYYAFTLFLLTAIRVARITMPSDILAYMFFPIFYTALTIGCWHIIRLAGRPPASRVLEWCGMYAGGAIVIGLIQPSPFALSFHEIVLSVLYLIADALLLTLVYALFRNRTKENATGIYILAFALLAQAAGDIVYGYLFSQRISYRGDISSVLYATSGLGFALGVFVLGKSRNDTPGGNTTAPIPASG